jgi:uncharacterized protein YjbJ (UPF0337 family)
MNWDRIKGNWHQVSGKVQAEWGKLTEWQRKATDAWFDKPKKTD